MYKKRLRLIAILVFIVAVATSLIFYLSVQTYRFSENAFYPSFGEQYQIKSGDKAVVQRGDNCCEINCSGTKITADESCVYFKDRNAILLTSPMAYYPELYSDEFLSFKLNTFTEITSRGADIYIRDGSKSIEEPGSFLYNGKDTYVLLRSGTLKFADRRIKLSPLSYVIVKYGNWVEFYDHESDTYELVEISGDTNVTIDMKFDYAQMQIMPNIDCAEWAERKYMIIPAINILKDYFK